MNVCRWHDAGTYDVKTKTGGPNGSIRNEEEYTHGSNNGLKKAVDFCGMFMLFIYHSLVDLFIFILNLENSYALNKENSVYEK